MTKTQTPFLHVITGLRTGGAERALFRLVERGLARAFDTHVVSMEGEGTLGPQLRDVGAVVHTLNVRGNPREALSALVRITRTVRPAIIQGWMYHGNLGASLAALISPGHVPVLWNIRQGLDDIEVEKRLTRQVIRLNRLLSRSPAHIIYNSHRSRKQHESFGFACAHGLVIPNGFDLESFVADPAARQRVRAELGVPVSAPLLGHFARLHPMKDHVGLLRAAQAALSKGLDAHFLLVGSDVAPATIRLHDIVDPRFHHRFHVQGERADVPALMQAIDIYVSSSVRAEGFPNVIGEAMASARPCIGTDIGDSAHVIGDTGIVVPPSDPAALAAAMLRLCSDPDTRAALGQSALKSVQERYDINGVVDRYINLYNSTLGALAGN